jgi:uncharacterized OsmC-like protein/pimeloyl-ACP methyl ester carboxylesterase
VPQEQVTFDGVHGGRLSGVLDLPDGRARSWAVFAHCFTCSKDSHAASRISRALASRGIGVLRYDFTGLGESDGEFADATFTSDVANLVAAADHLRSQGRAPGLLVGHSLGGAAVVAAAGQVPEVVAVATVNAPAHPGHVKGLLEPAADELREQGAACVRIGGRAFFVRQALVDDLDGQAQRDRLASLKAALLVMHAPADETVGIENARELFDQARHPKSFVALDGADHLLSRRRDSLYAADVIASWASRYLAVAEPEPEPLQREAAEDEATPAGVVVVRETGAGPFTQQVTAGRHTWLADEPTDVPGGTDTGPTPYDHLLAGLGTCTTMTLRMYATRKKIPLERVTVTLGQQHVHADDLSACVDGSADGCLRQFTREVHLEGDLTDEQRDKLLEIADKCPVHRTLEAGVEVVTTLAD